MKAKAHKKITQKVLEIFKQYCQGNFVKKLEKYGAEIVDGSVDADKFPIFERATNWHFYKENNKLKPTKVGPVMVHPTSDHILNKRVSQLEECITAAREADTPATRDDALEEAFELVGRALHHIQDMSTPTHITPIYHGPDFPFNQVDDALIISDHFENYSSDGELMNRVLDSISITEEEFEYLRSGARASFIDTYVDAAKESLSYIFENDAENYMEGMVDGKPAQLPFSMFWQRHQQTPADGRIKGFGSFGPLEKMFDEPGEPIEVEGKTYRVLPQALEDFCTVLMNKMVRDSLRALFVAETMMKGVDLQIDSIVPVYGENYDKGYIGFSYEKGAIVSIGIAFITRWARISDVKVSHAFVVTGEDSCVEAVGKGVQVQTLKHYFDNPHYQVFFRKPVQYNADVANRICQTASEQVGEAYDHSLIPAHAMFGFKWLKRLNKLTGGIFRSLVMRLMNSEDEWICSELAAYSLDEQPEYHDKGVLRQRNEAIDPQALFEDNEIFTAWKKHLSKSVR